MTISAVGVAIIVGTLLPILVGLLTHVDAPPKVKVVVQSVLAAIGGVVVHGITNDGVAIVSWDAIVTAVLVWIQSTAAYLGVFKPLTWGADNSGINSALLPELGIGKPPTAPDFDTD